jgi:hypothetical protein
MKHRRLALSVGILVPLLLLASHPVAAQQPTPVHATLEQFKRLGWLAGAWQGSGAAAPVFFEEYRIVDDSTIRMRSFKDDALSKVSDSASIELRNGVVTHRHPGRASVAVELTASTAHFLPEGGTKGGFTFNRQSADLWTATLHSTDPDKHDTVYLMRRLRQ